MAGVSMVDCMADRELEEFTVRPEPEDPRLSVAVSGIDHEGRASIPPSSSSGR